MEEGIIGVRYFFQDFSVAVLLLVISLITFQTGMIALAVPLGIGGLTMMVLIVYVIVHLVRD